MHQGIPHPLHHTGPFRGTFGMGGCVDLIGGGDSPVLEYDRAVIRAALDHLGQAHTRPQCVVVGTYGPHFSYVAPPDLFRRYRDRVRVPPSWNGERNYRHPLFDKKSQRRRTNPRTDEEEPVTEEVMLAARAAYFGMITHLDRQIGQVREAWGDHLGSTGRPGIFAYVSDHGDTAGEHRIFGKQTFYEGSVGIPLLFEGQGLPAGATCRGAVSIMDLGPTLCEMADVPPPPAQDGRSLAPALREGAGDPDRAVLSEWVEPDQEGRPVPGRMIRRGRWKFTTFAGRDDLDLLFDLEEDPAELQDVRRQHPARARELKGELEAGWEPERIARRYAERRQHLELLSRWARAVEPAQSECRQIPDHACRMPEVYL